MKQTFLMRLEVTHHAKQRRRFYAHICIRGLSDEEAVERSTFALSRNGYCIDQVVSIEIVGRGTEIHYSAAERALLLKAKARRSGIALFLRESLHVEAAALPA